MQTFRKVTHVLFDLDGLLLDTERIYTDIANAILHKYGKTCDWSMKLQLMGLRGYDQARKLVESLDLPITPDEYYQMSKALYKTYMSGAVLMPGAEKLVKHLHSNRVPIAVASSSHRDSYSIKTATHQEFFKLFHHIVTGGDDPEVKNGKPAPDIFLICASRFADKPKPANCLVFEDAPNGVTAALKAGMQCVIVPDENVPDHMYKHATLKLNSLSEFKPELFGLPPIKA